MSIGRAISPVKLPSSRSALATLAVVLSVSVSGCDLPRIPDAVHPEVTDYTRRHPIVVAPTTESVDIAIGRSGASHDQAYIEATRFLRSYKRSPGGPLFVSVPGEARAAASLMRTAVHREGIPPDRVKWTYKPADGIITLSYDRIAAIAPKCGDWSEDVTRNPERIPYPDFGCSQQRNIAAMAANPTDTMFPAREVPRIGVERPGAPKSSGAGGGGAAAPAAAAPAAPAAATPAPLSN